MELRYELEKSNLNKKKKKETHGIDIILCERIMLHFKIFQFKINLNLANLNFPLNVLFYSIQ